MKVKIKKHFVCNVAFCRYLKFMNCVRGIQYFTAKSTFLIPCCDEKKES